MKFDEIKKLPNKAVVTAVEGRVKNIYTKNPTANQARYKIHPQEVVLLDDNGLDLTVVIMTKEMHLPAGSQGRTARFEAGENERGTPDGLVIDVYNNHPAKVNCGGFASVRLLEGEPQALPEAKSTGGMRLVNLKDHEQTIVNLFNGILEKISGEPSVERDEIAAKLATTVYIECSKNGLIQATQEGNPVPGEVQKMVEQVHSPEEESSSRPVPTIAEIVKKKLDNEPVDLEKLDRFLKKTNQTWEKVYDEMANQVSRTYPRKYVDQVYDEFNSMRLAHGSKQTEDEFLATLFRDSESFVSTVKDVYEEESKKQQEAESQQNADDDIPF